MIEDNSRISDRINTEPAVTETSIPLDGGNSVETAFPDNSSSGNSSPDHTDSEGSSSEENGSLTLNKREIPTGLEKPVFFCQIFQN